MQENKPSSERPSRTRKAFQFLFLFVLLIVAPIGSWMYLRSGLDYRKEHLGSLEEGVAIPVLSWMTLEGDPISSDDWQEQISLILFGRDSAEIHRQIDQMALVLSQFDDRDDVMFYQIIADTLLMPGGLAVADTAQWKFIRPADDATSGFESFCKRHFPADSGQAVFLVDRRGVLRQAFSIEDRAALTSLVEVVAILLPPKKLSHPELNRTKEK